MVAFIKAEDIQEIEVIGHTDWQGTPEYNSGLSKRRAEAVADEIRRKMTRPLSISTRGLGEDCPRIISQADQYTEEQLARMYRRVAIAWPRAVNSQLDACDPNGIIDR